MPEGKQCIPLFISVPRYVRVNTLVSSTEKVCTRLIEEGWKQVQWKKKSGYESFIERVKILARDEFVVDFHLDFLLVFPFSAQFHNHSLLKNGSILLQDKVIEYSNSNIRKMLKLPFFFHKASCLSAVALKPNKEFAGKIIDACSAPGMKTSLLAALSNNQKYLLCLLRKFQVTLCFSSSVLLLQLKEMLKDAKLCAKLCPMLVHQRSQFIALIFSN